MSLVDLKNIAMRVAVAVALGSSLLFARCSKTSTSVTAPTDAKCQVTVGGAPAAPFPPSGGTGSISVSTTRDCTWSVSADASWVALTTTSGQGPGMVAFTIAANPVPISRSGALIVASQRVPLSQAAARCRFDLNKTADRISADGGRLSVTITTLTGCAWSAAT